MMQKLSAKERLDFGTASIAICETINAIGCYDLTETSILTNVARSLMKWGPSVPHVFAEHERHIITSGWNEKSPATHRFAFWLDASKQVFEAATAHRACANFLHVLFLETCRVAGGVPDAERDYATIDQLISEHIEPIRMILNQAGNAVNPAEITAAVEKMKQELALAVKADLPLGLKGDEGSSESENNWPSFRNSETEPRALDSNAIPAEFREGGKPDGELLTTNYLVGHPDWLLNSPYISKNFGPDEPLTRRIKCGRKYVYRYDELVKLRHTKTARSSD